MDTDTSLPAPSPRVDEVGDGRPIFAGVVGADGKTRPGPDDFRVLIGKTMEIHARWARNRQAVPSIRGLLPTGADQAGVRFRGWEVADHRSISILDAYVKEADNRYQVLPTHQIRENQGVIWQASLGSV